MAKTKDMPKVRIGNTPTPAGAVPPSALPGGREPGEWEPGVRAGAGGLGSKPTGGNAGGIRQGGTPAVVADLDAPGQRHTSSGGKVEINSENFPTRENAVLNNETIANKGGLFPFKTATNGSDYNYLQRSRVPRQSVEDAEIKALSDKKFKNEKDQRKGATLGGDLMNPRNQR